jgi:hypothetical protein
VQTYRRFCSASVVEETLEGPALAVCGVGYRNRNRTIFKNVDLCERHLKSRIHKKHRNLSPMISPKIHSEMSQNVQFKKTEVS